MTRKTKAERDAERAAYLAEEEARLAPTYPTRLIKAIHQATKFHMNIYAEDGVFVVKEIRGDRRSDDWYERESRLGLEFTRDNESELVDFEYDLERKEAEILEAKRLADLRVEALRKVNELLTDEERKVLQIPLH